MSVTNYQYPSSYTPAFNPQIFTAVSSNVASTNFKYTIYCTDLITSTVSSPYNIEQRPDTKLVFDASNFTKNYIKNYIPNNAYGFQRCTDAIRKIRVNIGETYGSTPTYVSGTNLDYIVWNGMEKWDKWPSYTSTDYVYKTSTNNFKFITSDNYPTIASHITSNKITYSNKSHFVYCLSSENNDFQGIRISTYDANGNFINYSDIANPYTTGTTYTDKYVCIDVGHKGLTNIASGLVTGTWPIITNQVSYYEVIDNSGANLTTISRIYIGCEPRYDVYTLHYLSKSGNFETVNFSKLSEKTVTANKTMYRQNPYTYSSNVWSYSAFTPNERVLNSEESITYKLNSDFMTEDQILLHSNIVSSPVVYMDMGSTTGLIPVIVTSNQALINKKYNNRVYSMTIDVRLTYKNVYQNG